MNNRSTVSGFRVEGEKSWDPTFVTSARPSRAYSTLAPPSLPPPRYTHIYRKLQCLESDSHAGEAAAGLVLLLFYCTLRSIFYCLLRMALFFGVVCGPEQVAAEAARCHKEPAQVFACMVELYDNCKAGLGPHSLCDYYDD